MKCVNALFVLSTLCDNVIQLFFDANTSVAILSQRALKLGTARNRRRQKMAKGTVYMKENRQKLH